MLQKTRKGKGILWTLALLSTLFGACVSVHADDVVTVAVDVEDQKLLFRAEDLLGIGQAQQAYDLLIPQESRLAGSALYDYLLGVAALDSGRLGEAIFGLQRSLAVEPSFSAARMELARAYYESGNENLARPLFAQLLDEDPPRGVRIVVNKYIDAIDAIPPEPRSRLTPFADLNLGHDTNANRSTDDQQFLGFTLSPENVEESSQFIEIGAGIDWLVARGSQLDWVFLGRVSQRVNPDAAFVDATNLSGLAGMNWSRGAFFGRAGIDAYWGAREGASNATYSGLDVLFGRRVNDRWDFSVGLRGGAKRFEDSINTLDVDRYLYTLGVTRRFHAALISVQAIGGDDAEVTSGSPYGNSKAGGRVSMNAQVGTSAMLFASVGTLKSDYDGLFFGMTREDTQLTSLVQLEIQDFLTDGLSIAPRVRYVDNESDVPLYEYDRTEYGVTFRWAVN